MAALSRCSWCGRPAMYLSIAPHGAVSREPDRFHRCRNNSTDPTWPCAFTSFITSKPDSTLENDCPRSSRAATPTGYGPGVDRAGDSPVLGDSRRLACGLPGPLVEPVVAIESLLLEV